jgi:hypothetical protein
MNQVARRAGVGAGTLYRNFPTRESLVLAVYRDEVARVIEAAPATGGREPIGFLAPGSTYHSNFALVPPSESKLLEGHEIGDYAISPCSYGPYHVAADKTNDPFGQTTPEAGDYCWRWRDPESKTIHWMRLYCCDQTDVTSRQGTMTFRLERVVPGGAPAVLAELKCTNLQLFGETFHNFYSYRAFVQDIQHSASGCTGLLMIGRRKFDSVLSDEDEFVGTKPLWGVIRADVSGMASGSLGVFRTYDQLHPPGDVLAESSGTARTAYASVRRVRSAGTYFLENHGIFNTVPMPWFDSLVYAVLHTEVEFAFVREESVPIEYSHNESTQVDVLWYFFSGDSEEPDEVTMKGVLKNNLDSGYEASGSVTITYDAFHHFQSGPPPGDYQVIAVSEGNPSASGDLSPYTQWNESTNGTEWTVTVGGRSETFPLLRRDRIDYTIPYETFVHPPGSLLAFPKYFVWGIGAGWDWFPDDFGSQPVRRHEPNADYVDGSASWDIGLTVENGEIAEPPDFVDAGYPRMLPAERVDTTAGKDNYVTECRMATNNVVWFSFYEYVMIGARVEVPGTRRSFLISKTRTFEIDPEKDWHTSWNPRTSEQAEPNERIVQWL